MQGYRTFIVAGISFVAPAIARWGFNVDPAVVADTVIIVVPALMALMRSITKTAPGKTDA
jgi:hypothetical protein